MQRFRKWSAVDPLDSPSPKADFISINARTSEKYGLSRPSSLASCSDSVAAEQWSGQSSPIPSFTSHRGLKFITTLNSMSTNASLKTKTTNQQAPLGSLSFSQTFLPNFVFQPLEGDKAVDELDLSNTLNFELKEDPGTNLSFSEELADFSL